MKVTSKTNVKFCVNLRCSKEDLENNRATMFLQKKQYDKIVSLRKPMPKDLITEYLRNQEYPIENFEPTFIHFDNSYQDYNLNDLYFQNLKEIAGSLFLGYNSSVFLFGPTNSGKTYLLSGAIDTGEDGILKRSIKDILSKIELNKRINSDCQFVLSLVSYQIINSQIYDTLNNGKEIYLSKEYYNEFQSQLTKREIIAIEDFEKLQVEIRKNSLNASVVTTLLLDKISNLREDFNARSLHSQADFVELPSSQYGLPKERQLKEEEKGTLYKTVNNVFNSVYNNIVSTAVNLVPTYETMLTLALKPTIQAESNIYFISCLLPCEMSSYETEKALRFAVMIRDHIKDYSYEKICDKIPNFNSEFNNVRLGYCPTDTNLKKIGERKMYVAEKPDTNSKEELSGNQLSTLVPSQHSRQKNPISSSDAVGGDSEDEEFYDKRLKKKGNNFYQNNNESYQYNSSTSFFSSANRREAGQKSALDKSTSVTERIKNEIHAFRKKVNPIPHRNGNEEELFERDRKILELEKEIMSLKKENQSLIEELAAVNENFSRLKNSDSTNKQLVNENRTLLFDNQIIKEENEKLNTLLLELNNDVDDFKQKYLELIGQNEHLIRDRELKEKDIEEMRDSLARLKYYERNNTFYGHFDTRVIMESQIRELESANKRLTEEKQNLEVTHRILVERHSDTVKTLQNTENELGLLQRSMSDQVSSLDDKLTKITKDLDIIQGENKALRNAEDKFRTERVLLEREIETYRDKYLKNKEKVAALNAKFNSFEIENQRKTIENELQIKLEEERKKREIEKAKNNKIQAKLSAIKDIQSKVSSYKQDLRMKRMTHHKSHLYNTQSNQQNYPQSPSSGDNNDAVDYSF